jgi:hypothetical protein
MGAHVQHAHFLFRSVDGVYHSHVRLVYIFRDCYIDHRDIKKVLDIITRKSGLVKLAGQTLMVMLEWIDI